MTSESRQRLLFICSRNQWRSPTAERVFARDPRFAVRSCGFSSKSPRVLSASDVEWADVVFVMEHDHASRLRKKHRDQLTGKTVVVLDIPDEFTFMDPELIALLEARVGDHLGVD